MNDDVKKRIGGRIRTARTEAGLSKATFCLMCGISRPYLDGLEAGARNPTLDMLIRISEGLGMELSELLR